jgi:hypothetical protein
MGVTVRFGSVNDGPSFGSPPVRAVFACPTSNRELEPVDRRRARRFSQY